MWMNEMDIEEAAQVGRKLGGPAQKASAFLMAFCNLINDISDGWAHWSYGTKCSNDLQKLVNPLPYQYGDSSHLTTVEVDTACRKVIVFLKRCKQTKDKPEVLDFLKRH